MADTVSAIIPVYNNGPYIAAAVESILSQTTLPNEIIVVDDGSTDNTAMELQRYSGKIKYIYQSNQGEPAARNRGVREATGDFVAFLDGDDLWRSDKLELQMRYLLNQPECALVYSDMSTFNQQGVIDRSVRKALGMTFREGYIFPLLFRRPLFGSGTAVLRKECISRVGYFDEDLLVGSDYEMWLRISYHFKVGFVDEPLLMYRYHPNMSTLSTGRKMCNGVPWEAMVLQKILWLYPDALEQIGGREVNRRLSKPYASSALSQLRQREFESARSLFRKAIAYWPTNFRYFAMYAATFVHPRQISAARRFYRQVTSWHRARHY